jgi:SAM-dependent methyltransferase
MPEDRWETFARRNAEYYIYTAEGVDFHSREGRRLFIGSGYADAAQILDESAPYLTGWDRAVEIGCGVGRLTIPMAERFGDVVAVDIAPTMLRKLAGNARTAECPNVRGFLPDQPWFRQGAADLVYSLIVFQHIESWAEIARYFDRIARCLAPAGVCYAQFDSRPATLPYKAIGYAPDPLLPRAWRTGIRRIRRTRAGLLDLFGSCGLRVARELRPDSERHTFVLTL